MYSCMTMTMQKGQVLFHADLVRFELARRQTEATVESSRAALVEAARASPIATTRRRHWVSRERDQTSDLMANINPTFSRVRLAQRIPVRIHLDEVPRGTRLFPGRTATVKIDRDDASFNAGVVARLLKAFG